MAKLEIDEDFLLEAVSSGDGSMLWYLDRQTGELYAFIQDEIGWDEEDGDLGDPDPASFDPASVADERQLRAFLELMPERFTVVEQMSSHEAFELMEDFASDQDGAPRARLLEALQRRRPFRNFKDALLEFDGLRERWYSFETARQRSWAREWLESIGVSAVLRRAVPPADSPG